VGKWVDITPDINIGAAVGNEGVNSFLIDPSNTATLYLGTYEYGIWKSTDCGASWKKISTGTLGEEISTGRNWTMAIDPVDPQVLYTNAGYGPPGLFKSINGGGDWVQLFDEDSEWAKYVDFAFVEFLALDPTDHKHLVISSHGECSGPYAGPTCWAESFDAGKTWRLLKADPEMGYEFVGHVVINKTTWLQFDPLGGILKTTDSGASWQVAYPAGAWNQTGTLYKANDGYYYAPSNDGVIKSKDGLSWSLIEGSPRSASLAGDGDTIFTSFQDDAPEQPYYTSSGTLTSWKQYPAPKLKRGSWLMRYDRDHNLLYTSNEAGGFWRVQTK
jgi:photosystem II stability/assembly factor-like uncharacterized protein